MVIFVLLCERKGDAGVTKKVTILIVFLVIAAGALGFLFVYQTAPDKKGAVISSRSADSPAPGGMSIKGLQYKVRSRGALVAETDIEDFKIAPKKLFVFRVKSVNEAVITKARIRLYPHNIESDTPREKEAAADDDPLGALFKEFTDRKAGLITGVTVKEIDVGIYDSEVLTHRLSAARADFNAAKKLTTFYNATLEYPQLRKLIKADKMVWDAQAEMIRIPGSYTTSTRGGDSKGRGLQIDLINDGQY